MLGAQKSCARAKNGKFVKFHENIRQRKVPGNQNTTKQHQVQFLICPTTLIIPPLVPHYNVALLGLLVRYLALMMKIVTLI